MLSCVSKIAKHEGKAEKQKGI